VLRTDQRGQSLLFPVDQVPEAKQYARTAHRGKERPGSKRIARSGDRGIDLLLRSEWDPTGNLAGRRIVDIAFAPRTPRP
jgi:hypothetical protein